MSTIAAPLLGLALVLFIVLGPGATAFDLTSALRGIALFIAIQWLLIPSVARLWRAADDRSR